MKNIFALTLVTCASVSLGVVGSAFANTNPVEAPRDLMTAEALDAQLQADQVDSQNLAELGEINELDVVRPGHPGGYPGGHHGYPGHGHPGHYYPAPRPIPHYPHPHPHYPRPVPYPVPYPTPYPHRHLVTCYAQSPANGLTYSGTAYTAYAAQNQALDVCFNATGFECMSTGCRY